MNGMTGIVIFLLTTLSGGATGMYFSGRLSERCRVINSYITLVQSMNCYIGFSGYKLADTISISRIINSYSAVPSVTPLHKSKQVL